MSAYDQGYLVGYGDERGENPYNPDEKEYEEWENGCANGYDDS